MPVICTETYPSPSSYDEIFATYPYPLSDFQKYAIEAIINGHHVLSCAHTGSGKTLAAEFAIQHFVAQGKRVIYTSPIKALSNQKYYEFTQKYPHITFGLMTGDIKTNPCAQVLIMTTEILMNRLFTSPETAILDKENNNDSVGITPISANTMTLDFQIDLQTELAAVVFDEVHYINDADRGHVWEETIMMLPPHVQMVMLSATIDNPVGFAEWCETCGTRNTIINGEDAKKVYLASTEKRIVPLTHYLYFATTEEPFKKIKDKEQHRIIREATNQLLPILTPPSVTNGQKTNKFHEPGYNKIVQMTRLFNKERFYMKRKFVLNHLAEYLREHEMLPAIVFVFSRKHVEQCAHEITANLLEFDSKVAYTMRHECEQIVRKFHNAKEYLELPEFNDLVSLLEKGIGIHHSGMIPVLREIVEIMISKKCVKMLFATESFAIGLDCPIRSAVFTSLQKYTQKGLRYLHAHEYTQMAGRAGRRGIDTVGHIIHLNNLFREQPDIETYKTILGGKPQKLESKFHVTYSMVLNLMKQGKTTIEQMIEYTNSTMWSKSISMHTQSVEKVAQEKYAAFVKKREYLESQADTKAFVPQHIYKTYAELTKNMAMYTTKKRKEAEREIAALKDEYRTLLVYAEKYKELGELEKECQQENDYLIQLRGEVGYQVSCICDILSRDFGMICLKDDEQDNKDGAEYELTAMGNIAANMAEIHPVLAAKIVEKTEFYKDWSVADFAVFLSCFAQIKVDEEFRRLAVPDTVSKEIRTVLKFATEQIDLLEKTETEREVYTGICYKDMLTYDLVEEIAEWAACDTEQQCKYFIQVVLAKRGIGVGDFTKAVLKIATISRELQTVCEMFENLGAAQILSKVEGAILKYVSTCQSLYV